MGIIVAIILALTGKVIDPTNGFNSTTTTVNSKTVIDPTNGFNSTTTTVNSKTIIDPTNG